MEHALAAKRIALIIGNSSYRTIGDLDNPVSDARLIKRSLESAGFETTLLIDAGQTAMKRAISGFGARLEALGPDRTGFFYFAGHGVQNRGRNYLIPSDSTIEREADLDIYAVQAEWILRQMEEARNNTNIIVLDACRNNPFTRRFRSPSRGLARMSAPNGSFVAYSTATGEVASDGEDVSTQ